MKTTFYILTILLALNTLFIFAHNPFHEGNKAEPVKAETAINLEQLMPSPPALASFNDGEEYTATPVILVIQLAPSTPKIADFEDYSSATTIDIGKLAPGTPLESDFEESEPTQPAPPAILAPVTPAEADFGI